ncbi:hypothetical protein [Chroogloeocystis siderophila]|jgi:radical SAM superfamily enzyme YgiQ (UPF0313 family)|uniref:hypothetical protein n=1 Tax=Chroogloeocystis siderophila TaxID=329163 RepID=UPI001F22ADA9|nr:hypothetical protein [Chroogloeocystis siderophila]
MVQTGFTIVFMGIETSDTDSLVGIHKLQNTRQDLIESCHKITRAGLQIMSGFIVGFDNERPGAGKRIQAFIEETGIPQCLFSLLQALQNTAMGHRLQKEGRLSDWVRASSPRCNYEFCANSSSRRTDRRVYRCILPYL